MHTGHRIFFFLRNRELDELYLSVFLRNLASSLINIFVPVFLFQLGYSLSTIALFYIVHIASQALLFPLGFILGARIGVKNTMAIGLGLQVLFYFSLQSLPDIHYLIPALIFSAAGIFFWPAYHLDLARNLDGSYEGRELSFLHSISLIAVILGPIIGALLIVNSSFSMTFTLVAAIMFLAMLPLLLTKDEKINNAFSFKKSFFSGSVRNALAHFGEGIDNYAGMIIWPLFIYLSLINVISLGGIISLGSLIVMFYILWLGPRVDGNKLKVLRLGVLFNIPIWFLRATFITPIGLFLSNLAGVLSFRTIQIPLQKFLYQETHGTTDYLYFRELFLCLGRVTVLFIPLLGLPLIFAFIFAGLASSLFLFQKSSRSSRASK